MTKLWKHSCIVCAVLALAACAPALARTTSEALSPSAMPIDPGDYVPAVPIETYNLEPTPRADLYDLDHYHYYTWGIDTPWPEDLHAVAARLTFDNIRNWDDQPNQLYIHLLDDAPLGTTVGNDKPTGGDNFAGQGILLHTYIDLPSTARDLTYRFDRKEIAVLNDYADDGRFALGFDPDCHFYNCGIGLDIVAISDIPEPITLSLLLIGSLFFRPKRRPSATG